MKAKSYNVNKNLSERLEKKGLELSVKKGGYIKPAEIIKFLLEKYVDKIDYKNNKITIPNE